MSISGTKAKAALLAEAGQLPQHLHQFLDFVLPPERRYLGGIIVLSLLGHLLCFFLFQIKIAPPFRNPRPPMQVTLASVPGELQMGQETLSVLEIRNPSIFAIPPSMPGEEKRMMGQPEILAPPLDLMAGSKMPASLGLAAGLEAVESRAVRSIKSLKAQPMPVTVETPPPLRGSSYLLTGPAGQRKIIRRPELPKPETKDIRGCTQLQILVNALGLVEFATVEESCGDPVIDQMGLAAVKSLVLAKGASMTSPLEAGRVTIYWDFVEKSKPLEISPAPPAGGGTLPP